ncbi:MAG: hypothetical protein K2F57_00915 [Candidatus Gastranaerophilales bacterium]|nr:hypothetical protein [Candidatus Gastranaerophilales bacterium]
MNTIEIKEFKELPFGENITQAAAISPVENGIEYEILSDNESLEYIDYLNLSKVIEILAEFFDVNAIAASKENQLCAAALGSNAQNALDKIIECDPISLAGGTLGFSKEVTEDIAKQLNAMQIRNLIATQFDKKALEYLLKNSSINILQIKSPLQEILGFNAVDIKLTPFGYIVQEQNQSKLTKSSFKVTGKSKPTQQQAEDAIFAWKISKYAKSKSAVIAKDLSVKAIVQGRTNSIEATEAAMDLACENTKDAVLAIDGVIENEEVINAAIQGRIGLIIEAGDGSNSTKIAKLADKYNITLITTGIRNNKY